MPTVAQITSNAYFESKIKGLKIRIAYLRSRRALYRRYGFESRAKKSLKTIQIQKIDDEIEKLKAEIRKLREYQRGMNRAAGKIKLKKVFKDDEEKKDDD